MFHLILVSLAYISKFAFSISFYVSFYMLLKMHRNTPKYFTDKHIGRVFTVIGRFESITGSNSTLVRSGRVTTLPHCSISLISE